jgi:cytidyltransferase-like protein
MRKIVLITGGLDPLHSGHLDYIRDAKKRGDILVVGLNSDSWLVRKKGKAFLPWEERKEIVKSIVGVDVVISFDDRDNTAKDAIRGTRQLFPDDTIIFANGGDRTSENIPEMDIADDNVQFVFGVGGDDKKNSSSWILNNWTENRTDRTWGYYRVLHSPNDTVKVKELTVDPGKSLSMQRHQKRAEHWFVAEGTANVYTISKTTSDFELLGVFTQHQSLHIDKTQWHQLANETEQPLKIIEIQYGEDCVEEDIERIPQK